MGKTLALAEHKEERSIVQAHGAGDQDNIRGSAESLPSTIWRPDMCFAISSNSTYLGREKEFSYIWDK